MAPTRGRRKKDYDVVVQGQSAEKVAAEVAAHVAAKGFCTVDPRLDDDLLRSGREDIVAADTQGLLKQPPAMVHDGLLGEEGSSMILDLLQEDVAASAREFRHLKALDTAMSELVQVLQLSMHQLGFGALSKTHGLLHETGLAPEHAPDPTEHEASYWLGTLAQKKLMILLCLGPVRGTLELQPYDEEAEAYEVPTIPGSFIILRADAMWHRHCAHSKAYILSCFLVGAENRKGSNWTPPCAKGLEQWTVERMRFLKESQAKTQERLDLPAGWITAMNHMFHTAQRVAVRSVAARYPSSWDVQSWYLAQPSGPDLVTEVPLSRWDVNVYFDEEENAWRRGKTHARHGSFVDGTEYFDNKFFGLSVLEAKGMDPHQRVVLEVGYEACHGAGYSKGKLMNKIGGVYLGSSSTVFGMVSEVSGATGGAASINSNRFSFCLGLKGPSMTCDTDGSSSLTAVHLGGEAVLLKGHGVSNEFSLAGGVAFQLGPVYLAQMQAAGLLGNLGRCFTWDVSAMGYTMGDGCGFVVQKRMAEWVEGRQVLIEGEPLVASICGSGCATIGMGAAMHAPHGPSEQELVAQTLRTAQLDPLNIDAVECNGQGALLRDAVEADSLLRVLRHGLETPLPLTAVKSRMGYATEAAGVASLHRLMLSGLCGVLAPNNHLQQLNPHLSFDSKGALLTEPVETAMASTYMGVQSHGFGGTQVHVIAYCHHYSTRTAAPVVEPQRQSVFNFWPGGGGELEEEQLPTRGYYIAGTWTKWRAIKMENEGGDSFGYTMTLGENRWEEFQIYLDGDERRKLHPEQARAGKGVLVKGPDAKARGLHWRIEGRGRWLDVPGEALEAVALGNPERTSKAIEAIGSGLRSEPPSDGRLMEYGSGDVGVPGEKYRIRLRVAGRYRTVLWEKLADEDGLDAPPGDYAVTGPFNGWALDPMALRNDCWSAEVTLQGDSEFQIVRNEDWGQLIAPKGRQCSAHELGQGPDHCGQFRGCSWALKGRPGDVYRITFKREMIKQVSGKLEDQKRVSWEKLREASPPSIGGFGVLGSWNGFGRVHKMQASPSADGQTVYNFLVEIGQDCYESFQLVNGFDWNRLVHPDRPVTVPGSERRILESNMDAFRQDLVWALGVEKVNSVGDVYKVEVLTRGESVLSVSWHLLDEAPKGREVLGA